MFNKYIADKTFYRNLFVVVIPIVLQFFIQNFINFLDNIMVGQLGESEIAAVAIANQYYKLFYPAIISICTGAAIFTSQYFSAGKKDELQKVFGIKLIFPFLITIVFVLIGTFFTEDIIRSFTKDQLVIEHGISYLRIVVWSYIPIAFSTAFTFTLRPLKMTKLPMIASSIGMITNLILNYFLIYGISIFPELGVTGAAIGTVIARFVEFGIYLVIYAKNDFAFKSNIFNYLTLNYNITISVFKKVIPLFINELSYSAALIIIFKAYSSLGKSAINVINITDILSQFTFIIASGLGTATSIFVGHNLGQDNKEEALKNARYLLGYAFIAGVLIMFILSLGAFFVPSFYNINESTKVLTKYAILIQAFVVPVAMLTRIPFFVLRSGGRVYEIMLLDSFFMWVVKVPTAVIFAYVLNVNIIILFLAVESTRILNAFVSLYFFRQKKWLNNLT